MVAPCFQDAPLVFSCNIPTFTGSTSLAVDSISLHVYTMEHVDVSRFDDWNIPCIYIYKYNQIHAYLYYMYK
jgi:hypothetical protein